jgi:DNA-binding NtrC family response regulator
METSKKEGDLLMAFILVADDEPIICMSCTRVLVEQSHNVRCASTAAECLKMLSEGSYDLVLMDLLLPDRDGTSTIKEIKESHPSLEVVVITGHASIRSAVDAIRAGAYDYLPKPFTPEELLVVVEKALKSHAIKRENLLLKRELGSMKRATRLVGKSPAMREVFSLIRRVAPSDSTVMIYGETGTGKELVAKAIHRNSPRRRGRFVAVDCSAIPENLLESELFGHLKGAFTGASASKAGLMEVADGGTFFLDEVGQMSQSVQAKLLRVLQEREILPLGAIQPKRIDVRIIAASQPDLQELVSRRLFRKDLFYRLHIVPIYLPPLRDRREDIPLLAKIFLRKITGSNGHGTRRLHPAAIQKLMEHSWPGNVRELENVLERAAILSDGDDILPEHLILGESDSRVSMALTSPMTKDELKAIKKDVRRRAVEEIERAFVLQALARNSWNISRAARETKMKRQNFQALMRKLQIRRHMKIIPME